MENDMSDIAKELRERSLRAEQEGEPLALLDEAADEIERLRLTDEEREAVERAVGFCECTTSPLPTSSQIATIRGLLDRTK
jgi:hypothetical protein